MRGRQHNNATIMSTQRRTAMTVYSKGNCNELPLSAAAASDV